MSDSQKYSEAYKKRDKDIVNFGLIRLLYRNGVINNETYKAISKHLGKGVVEGHLSPAFYDDLKAKLQAYPHNAVSDIEQMFIQVDNGELMVTEACERLNIGRSTYYRKYRKWKASQTSGVEET